MVRVPAIGRLSVVAAGKTSITFTAGLAGIRSSRGTCARDAQPNCRRTAAAPSPQTRSRSRCWRARPKSAATSAAVISAGVCGRRRTSGSPEDPPHPEIRAPVITTSIARTGLRREGTKSLAFFRDAFGTITIVPMTGLRRPASTSVGARSAEVSVGHHGAEVSCGPSSACTALTRANGRRLRRRSARGSAAALATISRT